MEAFYQAGLCDDPLGPEGDPAECRDTSEFLAPSASLRRPILTVGPRRRWPDCRNGPPYTAMTDIHASPGFSISLSFSTQLQHRQTTTNINAVYIIVSASASSIQ